MPGSVVLVKKDFILFVLLHCCKARLARHTHPSFLELLVNNPFILAMNFLHGLVQISGLL